MALKDYTKTDYHQRVQRVVDHIYNHMDDNLSSEAFAEIACLSHYHWHRIYQSIMHETPATTLRRARLMRAANMLITTNISIERIAKKAGYTSISSFTRRFTQDFKISPSAYRKKGEHTNQLNLNPTKEYFTMYDVNIVTLEPIQLVSMDHKGEYMDIGLVFDKIANIGIHHNLINEKTRWFGIYFDNPDEVPTSDLRSIAGFSVQNNTQPPEETKITTLDTGRYATIIHKGPYTDLMQAYEWFYGVWLVNSDETPRDAPPCEEYLNNPRDTTPAELLTKIYLPLT